MLVVLLNEARASAWDQVAAYAKMHGLLGNAEVRQILGTDDPLRASKLLRAWVERGLLVIDNPAAAKQHRRYRLVGSQPQAALFSNPLGKQPPEGDESQ